MNPSKLWALLMARGANLQGVGGGGAPEYTAADISMRLQGLRRGPFLMGMLKECGDVGGLGELERLLADDVTPVYVPDRAKSIYAGLAGLAVYETLFERPIPCRECNARGYRVVNHVGVECTPCRNTGGLGLTDRHRAELAVIPFSAWRSTWSGRYERVWTTAQSWHSEARSFMKRATNDYEELPFEEEAA